MRVSGKFPGGPGRRVGVFVLSLYAVESARRRPGDLESMVVWPQGAVLPGDMLTVLLELGRVQEEISARLMQLARSRGVDRFQQLPQITFSDENDLAAVEPEGREGSVSDAPA